MSERRRHGQQPETWYDARSGLDVVVNALAEHLIAGADAEDRQTTSGALLEPGVEPALAHPVEVGHRGATARQDDNAGIRNLLRDVGEGHDDTGFVREWFEIGEIARARKS